MNKLFVLLLAATLCAQPVCHANLFKTLASAAFGGLSGAFCDEQTVTTLYNKTRNYVGWGDGQPAQEEFDRRRHYVRLGLSATVALAHNILFNGEAGISGYILAAVCAPLFANYYDCIPRWWGRVRSWFTPAEQPANPVNPPAQH